MTASYDVIVRGGTVVDGTGADPFVADVAVSGDRIAAVGAVEGAAPLELDAAGKLVTPGFVDAHSHLDGNVTWEQALKPNSGHGVTSTVMGNCGVGFAPCRPDDRDFVIALMEGVEDIPRAVLEAGLPWGWESYPEYLGLLAARRYDMHVAGLLPHSCLRVYVMGQRAIDGERATAADIEAMEALVFEAVSAGAVGVGSTRLDGQKTLSGIPAPSIAAAGDELLGMARGMARAGRGVLQIAPEFNQYPRAEEELETLIGVARETGVGITYSLKQTNREPGGYRRMLERTAKANAEGLDIRPMVFGRPTGAIFGWECSFHRFVGAPSYKPLAALPLDERVVKLGEPGVREAILRETRDSEGGTGKGHRDFYKLMFPLGDTPDYEPQPEQSVSSLAARAGVHESEVIYDAMMRDAGHGLLLLASGNYPDGTLEPALEMMRFDTALLGLADAGAHCTVICDASAPTYMLSYWARDRTLGERLSVPFAVKRLTSDSADFFGLTDRGVVAPGKKADLNVIDHEALGLGLPRMEYDLPAGGKRLVQPATGYVATLVDGVVVRRDDEDTGERPGRLLR